MHFKKFSEIKIGDKAEMSKKILEKDIQTFAKLSGDFNPIHLDKEYASKTFFKKQIAHGMYVASFISTLLSKKLPGPGTIYLFQKIHFKKPAYINDVITTSVKVIEKKDKKERIILETICKNQNDEIIIEGIAEVMLIKNK